MTARLGIVDDHLIILDALARLLSAEPGWTIACACRDAAEALATATEGDAIDLLVVDLRMPGMSGTDLVRALRGRGWTKPVVVLTAEAPVEELAALLDLGIQGLVLKEEAPSVLIDCVRAVLAGDVWLGAESVGGARELLSAQRTERGRIARDLTKRELEISRLAAQGWQTKDIGAKLGIARGTVKIHLHRVYEKLDITTRVELANAIRQSGLR